MKRIASASKAYFYALLVVLVSVFYGVRSANRSSITRPFADHLSEYADMPGLKYAASTSEENLDRDLLGPGYPYVIGKVIPINKGARKIDDLYFDLPKDFRATTPEELGTVVWLDWSEQSVGRYTDGSPAIQIACDVTVIDKARGVVVDRETFYGSRPPSVKSRGERGAGSKPTGEVVAYLTQLPVDYPSVKAGPTNRSPDALAAAARPHEPRVVSPPRPIPQHRPQAAGREVPQASGPSPVQLPQSHVKQPQAAVELTGIIGLFAKNKALLVITEPGADKTPKQVIMEEGERVGSIEVLLIDVKKGEVRIRNSGVDGKLTFHARPSGPVTAAAQVAGEQPSFNSPPQNWPQSYGELSGPFEVRVQNPNHFSVRVGLRSSGKGKDFIVPPNASQAVLVPNGHYVTWFQYSSDPGGLYQGDSFQLQNNGAQITITKIVGGNYGIRKVN